ncbi:HECT domain-containing protein [Rozella allomycis CSF55]|uniref:HECT-type E3 ubiquitin transferase n=1 Tax=Rozella allomycis (strain CSF55) TaxID=988480 RepID=A0A075B0W4_ROZAC|nr:HECT domain-containing protein [Rozella allomycis CSF55]|eukprot:EPZ36204.1 HECT domain-containing protein [Rozella allomycis CSF55]
MFNSQLDFDEASVVNGEAYYYSLSYWTELSDDELNVCLDSLSRIESPNLLKLGHEFEVHLERLIEYNFVNLFNEDDQVMVRFPLPDSNKFAYLTVRITRSQNSLGSKSRNIAFYPINYDFPPYEEIVRSFDIRLVRDSIQLRYRESDESEDTYLTVNGKCQFVARTDRFGRGGHFELISSENETFYRLKVKNRMKFLKAKPNGSSVNELVPSLSSYRSEQQDKYFFQIVPIKTKVMVERRFPILSRQHRNRPSMGESIATLASDNNESLTPGATQTFIGQSPPGSSTVEQILENTQDEDVINSEPGSLLTSIPSSSLTMSDYSDYNDTIQEMEGHNNEWLTDDSSDEELYFAVRSLVQIEQQIVYILPLVIDRTDIIGPLKREITETLKFLQSHAGYNSRKLNLRVKFNGEMGQDLGGLTKSYLTLLGEHFLSLPNFLIKSESGFYYPAGGYRDKDMLILLGVYIALSLHHELPLVFNISPSFINLMTDENYMPSLYDVLVEEPSTYKWIINFLTQNVETPFSLDIGEKEVFVDEQSKHTVAREYVKWLLKDQIVDSAKIVAKGLKFMIPSVFTKFSDQLNSINIEREINIEELKKVTIYDDYTAFDSTIISFWRYMAEAENSKRQKVLKFITGMTHIPKEGIMIKKCSDINRFPAAHTCNNGFDLPEYLDYETLKYKLDEAIEQNTFGLILINSSDTPEGVRTPMSVNSKVMYAGGV